MLVPLLFPAALLPITLFWSGPVLTEGEGAAPRFFKGNTHTHSLWSDGDGAPEKIAAWYKDHGYHFLVLSDHNVLSAGERWFPVDGKDKRLTSARVAALQAQFGEDAVELRDRGDRREMRLQTLDDLRRRFEEPGAFRFIQGEEVTASYDPGRPGQSSKPIHVNALNVTAPIPPQRGDTLVETLNNNVDAIVAHGRWVGRPVLAHINHPNFGWALSWRDVAAVRADRFFEVFNGHRSVHNNGDETRDSMSSLWDKAMVMRLVELELGPLYGLATDDAHRYHGDDPVATPGRGWVMVRATELSDAAIVRAMQRGDFYSSSGVVVRDFMADASRYRVSLRAREGEALTTRFIGTRVKDDTLGPVGEVLMETTALDSEYPIQGDELYVRVEITSSFAHPDPSTDGDAQAAWLQPWVAPAR